MMVFVQSRMNSVSRRFDEGQALSKCCPRIRIRWSRLRTSKQIRELIHRLTRENGWGYSRILGEFAKLSMGKVVRTTVKTILKKHDYDPGQSVDPELGPTFDVSVLAHEDTHRPGFGEAPISGGDGCDQGGQSLAGIELSDCGRSGARPCEDVVEAIAVDVPGGDADAATVGDVAGEEIRDGDKRLIQPHRLATQGIDARPATGATAADEVGVAVAVEVTGRDKRTIAKS